MPAHAEWKPDKPITVIVPYPAGGVTDLVVRIVANDLEPVLGQKLVVVNQPGANGSVGTKAVMDAPKDGYTWLSGGVRDIGTYGVMGMLDTGIDDWHPFVIASIGSILSVNLDTGIDSVQGFVDAVKAQGDSFLVATAGPNSSGGTALGAIAQVAGIDPEQIVYDGGNPAILATVSGEAQATTQLALEQAEMIRAGRLKPLAAIGRTAVTIGDQKIHPIIRRVPRPAADRELRRHLPARRHARRRRRDAHQGLGRHRVELQGPRELCETRGCGVAPMAPDAAREAAAPLIAAAAWGLFDRGEAKASPEELGIPRPAANCRTDQDRPAMTELDGKALVKADLATGVVIASSALPSWSSPSSMPTFAERGVNPLTAPGIFPAVIGAALLLCGGILTLRSLAQAAAERRSDCSAAGAGRIVGTLA